MITSLRYDLPIITHHVNISFEKKKEPVLCYPLTLSNKLLNLKIFIPFLFSTLSLLRLSHPSEIMDNIYNFKQISFFILQNYFSTGQTKLYPLNFLYINSYSQLFGQSIAVVLEIQF